MIRTRVRAAGLLALLAVPWTVILYPDGTTYVFAWALVNLDPVHVTTLTEYLFVRTAGLPQHLLAWPVSTLLYALAVASAALGIAEIGEDVRVTAGLLAFAGVSHATFALGLRQPGILPIPVGTILLWGLAGAVFFGNRIYEQDGQR